MKTLRLVIAVTLLASAAVFGCSGTITAKVSNITPSAGVPGRMFYVTLDGNGLDKDLAGKFVDADGRETEKVMIDLSHGKRTGKTREASIRIAPDAPYGVYKLALQSGPDWQKGATCEVMGVAISVLNPVTARYIPCPVEGTFDESPAVACSQALLDWEEASDIFGRRVAKRYLVVEVKIRNLSRDFEYLLHDVRLGYGAETVTSRDRKLVRGVAEKGQMYDPRNMGIRLVEAAGSLFAGLTIFPFATRDLKNAINLFQGPTTTSIKQAFPDFTVNQMNRLSDSAFTTQTTVVPKGQAVSLVTFLSRHIFMDGNGEEDKEHKTDKTVDKRTRHSREFSELQRKLRVEIAGAHAREFQIGEPSAGTLEPLAAAANQPVHLRVGGANLDRASRVRLLSSSLTVQREEPLALIQNDARRAEAMFSKGLPDGTYRVSLLSPDGREHATPHTLIVAPAAPAHPTITDIRPSDWPLKSDGWNIVLRGENLDQIREIKVLNAAQAEDPSVVVADFATQDPHQATGKIVLKDAPAGLRYLRVVGKDGHVSLSSVWPVVRKVD